MQHTIILLLSLASALGESHSNDWPMCGADATRSGYTPQTLPEQLSRKWTYVAADAPSPAWPTRNRLHFDAAYQVVVADGRLFYGSSSNGKVYALDAVTGATLWTTYTDGPIRFAPAIWHDRLFVASDDGHLYCLAAVDGKVLWTLRGGPSDEMLLGNDRMISRWPARGGPVVLQDTVYFAAGIWPSEGVFVYSVSADTGQVVWCNDSSGSLQLDQPHKNAHARSGVAAQGYLAATADSLLVPTGRAVPAVYARSNGAFRYLQMQSNQHRGGADVVVADNVFHNSGAAYSLDDGSLLGELGRPLAIHPQFVVGTKGGCVVAWDRDKLFAERERSDRRGVTTKVKVLNSSTWSVAVPFHAERDATDREETTTPDNVMTSTDWSRPSGSETPGALIIADNKILVGGRGRVSMVDMTSQTLEWSANVRGTVHGLAIARGRLYVSTDQGVIACFDGSQTASPDTNLAKSHETAIQNDSKYGVVADGILRRTGIREGYCLDLACGKGELAIELARRSQLQIYAVDPDPGNVRAARAAFDAAGLYGTRITAHRRDLTNVGYPNCFADLIVSGRSVIEGAEVLAGASYSHMQCPQHGKACLGRPEAMHVEVRDSLTGAGNWTHQNGDFGNTLCSRDTIVRSPLEMLWFRDTDLVMSNRHGRGPGPLVQDGIMFVEGLNCLRAQSIYNGHIHWEYPLPGILASYHREHSIGAAWTGGNYCVCGDRLYILDGNRCLCLDTKSGQKVAEFVPPRHTNGEPGTWGYIACDGNLLFGSLVDEDYLVKCWSDQWDTSGQFTESQLLFALEASSGELKWTFTPEISVRHNAIAIGRGRMYLVDRTPAPFDNIRLTESDARAKAKRRAVASGDAEGDEFQRLTRHQPGRLQAIDIETGQTLWRGNENSFATLLAYSSQHDVLLAAYQAVHQATRESERGDRLAAFRGTDGELLWDVAADYVDRPVLRDRTIYAPPGAWDLLDGKRLPFTFDRSYGCGIVVGSQRLLVYRSATLGYLDLEGENCTENYGGIRPGCWIAGVPAGGLVLMQDAASWCTCSYLNQATIALQPRG